MKVEISVPEVVKIFKKIEKKPWVFDIRGKIEIILFQNAWA